MNPLPMPFPESFYQFLAEHTLVEIKGGTHRDSFLSIWMIQVEGRVFARSWTKSKRSWFTAFLDEGVGEIKYGELILPVSGRQLSAGDAIMTDIDQAYLTHYTQPENLQYARGITQPEYAHHTMEFFVLAQGVEPA